MMRRMFFPIIIGTLLFLSTMAAAVVYIYIPPGEKETFSHEDITSHRLENYGILHIDNCTLNLETCLLNRRDIMYVNDSILYAKEIENYGQARYYPCLFARNFTINNVETWSLFHTYRVENSSIKSCSNVKGTFHDCIFSACTFQKSYLYNSVTIKTYIDDNPAELQYQIIQNDGTTTYSGTGHHHTLLNRTYSPNSEYHYFLVTTLDDKIYNITFTALPNTILELRTYHDLDRDGVPDINDTDIDGDGWNNTIEEQYETNPWNNESYPADLDGDKIPDVDDEDMDGDGWNNTIEDQVGTDPHDNSSYPDDMDGDMIPDSLDDDIDGDGWNNTIEGLVGTDPENIDDYPSDIDGDMIPDILDDDMDGDGWNNSIEIQSGTDIGNQYDYPSDIDGDMIPDVLDDDMDGDGWNNSIEELVGTDPKNIDDFPEDLDEDGSPDTLDDDIDGDGWNNTIEELVFTNPKDYNSHPKDLDGDGIPDPLDRDMDGDGWNDTIELDAGTDPENIDDVPEDLDGNHIPDILELPDDKPDNGTPTNDTPDDTDEPDDLGPAGNDTPEITENTTISAGNRKIKLVVLICAVSAICIGIAAYSVFFIRKNNGTDTQKGSSEDVHEPEIEAVVGLRHWKPNIPQTRKNGYLLQENGVTSRVIGKTKPVRTGPYDFKGRGGEYSIEREHYQLPEDLTVAKIIRADFSTVPEHKSLTLNELRAGEQGEGASQRRS